MNAPSFRVEKIEGDGMLLHYYSDRKGLYHIVPGNLYPMELGKLYHIVRGRKLSDHILPGNL